MVAAEDDWPVQWHVFIPDKEDLTKEHIDVPAIDLR